LKRDKPSLDLFWIKDKSLTDTDACRSRDHRAESLTIEARWAVSKIAAARASAGANGYLIDETLWSADPVPASRCCGALPSLPDRSGRMVCASPSHPSTAELGVRPGLTVLYVLIAVALAHLRARSQQLADELWWRSCAQFLWSPAFSRPPIGSRSSSSCCCSRHPSLPVMSWRQSRVRLAVRT